jgi:hypothetical protein
MRNDKQANETPKSPKQQTGEEFGKIGEAQREGNREPERSDTPRGSEPETRGNSGRRG